MATSDKIFRVEFRAGVHKGKLIFMAGDGHEDAAKRAIRKVHAWGSRRGFGMSRETGTPGMGGVFTAYSTGNPRENLGVKVHCTEAV